MYEKVNVDDMYRYVLTVVSIVILWICFYDQYYEIGSYIYIIKKMEKEIWLYIQTSLFKGLFLTTMTFWWQTLFGKLYVLLAVIINIG